MMTLQQPNDRRTEDAPARPVRLIRPVRPDGELVTDPAFALPAPADFEPWDQVVVDYLAQWTGDWRRAA